VVDRALDDARVTDDPEYVIRLDELLGVGRDLAWVGLLGLKVVLDRVAVDAAIVVDAGEVSVGHVRDIGE
jgi:hypothetical protein